MCVNFLRILIGQSPFQSRLWLVGAPKTSILYRQITQNFTVAGSSAAVIQYMNQTSLWKHVWQNIESA